MKIKNVADLLTETLIEAGVKRIYGVVGDSLNGVTESLRQRPELEWVGVLLPPVASLK